MEPDRLMGIVEAVLVTAEEPVTPGKLLGLVKEANGRQLREAVDRLKEEYERTGRAFTVVEVAGGFQLATRNEFGPWVRKFHDKNRVRLSQAGLESLAIVAFKQPITRAEIDSIRGVNSGGVINHLLELNMIRIVGRSDGVGKPHLFGTTREFLVHFGLKGLADLPKPRELEELLAAGARKAGDAPQASETPPPATGDGTDENEESEGETAAGGAGVEAAGGEIDEGVAEDRPVDDPSAGFDEADDEGRGDPPVPQAGQAGDGGGAEDRPVDDPSAGLDEADDEERRDPPVPQAGQADEGRQGDPEESAA